ncbi:MAG: hypothetical protein K1X79_02635 [Oligoflexia bacterium]|nr:hypothetical protein [Oligoflexia bacterium]
MIQNVQWLTFCISNAVTRSIVHFFPSAANVAAPYSADCALTLFGRDFQRKTVRLEGARFGQPDGLRVEDAFPQLQEGTSGFFGLEFSMSTTQPRADILSSSCLVELSSRGHSCRFRPRQAALPEGTVAARPTKNYGPLPAVGIKDAFCTTSLVIVNASGEAYAPKIRVRRRLTGGDGEIELLAIDPLGPSAVIEVDLGEQFAPGDATPQEQSWGLVRTGGIWLQEEPPKDAALFLMYRDVVTRRPMSVMTF